jgi:hypothetical protein
VSEHAKRQALAGLLHERAGAYAASNVPPLDESNNPVPPGDYLTRRRSMELDPDRWLALRESRGYHADALPPPEPSILKSGQRDVLLDQ